MTDGSPVVIRGSLPLPVVLSCDHASGYIPPEFSGLGLTPQQLRQCEDLFDKGAAELFDFLARTLDCSGVKTAVSRLVVDVNRSPDHEQFIRQRCADHPIPGNQHLTADDIRRRTGRFYSPYHRHLKALLDDCEQRHGTAFFFPIHAMAERYHGQRREMDITLLYTDGCTLAAPVGAVLEQKGYVVRHNSPFILTSDLLRGPNGQLFQRFSRTALVIEINDKHRHNDDIRQTLAEAIRQVVTISAGPAAAGAAETRQVQVR